MRSDLASSEGERVGGRRRNECRADERCDAVGAGDGRGVAAAWRAECGAVGFEVLPFLVLVFMVGSLLFAQAWAVLDAKFATTGAAREAARTFVEQPAAGGDTAAARAATEAGRRALRGHGLAGDSDVNAVGSPRLVRCERITFEATARVPTVGLPLLARRGEMEVASRHTEVVDPLRSGLTGRGLCRT